MELSQSFWFRSACLHFCTPASYYFNNENAEDVSQALTSHKLLHKRALITVADSTQLLRNKTTIKSYWTGISPLRLPETATKLKAVHWMACMHKVSMKANNKQFFAGWMPPVKKTTIPLLAREDQKIDGALRHLASSYYIHSLQCNCLLEYIKRTKSFCTVNRDHAPPHPPLIGYKSNWNNSKAICMISQSYVFQIKKFQL